MRTTFFTLFTWLAVVWSQGASQAAVPVQPAAQPDTSETSEPASPVEAAPTSPVEAAPEEVTLEGALVEVIFKQGRVMRGKVISMSDEQLTLDTFTGLLLILELGQLKTIIEKRIEEFKGMVVHLSGGKVLTGDLVEMQGETLKMRMSLGAEIVLQRSTILRIHTQGEVAKVQTGAPQAYPSAPYGRADPSGGRHYTAQALYGPTARPEIIPSHRTRYLYAPSAMPLRQGEGYFSQKELLFSAAAFGVTDQMSVLIGSVIPALMFGGADGANAIFAVKYAWNPAEKLHLALATELIVIPGGEAAGLGGAVLTFGGHHNHFSLVASAPYSFNGNTFRSGSFLFTAAGALRTGKRWALLTENWVVGLGDGEFGGNPVAIGSIGMRRFGRDHAFDFALLGIAGAGFGFPWVDWTFSWGQRDVEGRRVGAQMPSAPPMVPQSSFANWQRQRAEIGLR